MPLVSRTRAALRSAEFGFFGVVVYTRVHTPRRWGLPLRAGVLVLSTLSSRPLRTSCWIVGTASPCSLLPFSVSFLSSRGRAVLPRREAPAAPRARACRPSPSGPSPSRTSAGRSGAPGTERPTPGGPAPTLARGTARGTPGTKYEATRAVLRASKRPFGRSPGAAGGARPPGGGAPPPGPPGRTPG